MANVIISGIQRDISIGSATQTTGSGLDDLTSGGTYTGINSATYEIVLSAEGTPDVFAWQKNEETPITGVDCDTSPISLSDGVTVTFGANTGHSFGNRWEIVVSGDITIDRSVTDEQLEYYYVTSDYNTTTILLREFVYNMQTGVGTLTADTYDGEEVTITSSSDLFANLSAVITQEQTDLSTDLTAQDSAKSFPDNPMDLS